MPRLPRIIHPLRTIRRCAGLTQPDFARKIGISTAMLQAIELRKRGHKLEPNLAARIAATFAVKLGTFESADRVPLGRDGRPYTREIYLIAVEGANLGTRADWNVLRRKQAMVLLDLLLQASAQKGMFENSTLSFEQWAKETIEDLQLRLAMERLHQEFEPVELTLEKQFQQKQAALHREIEVARKRGEDTGQLERLLARSHPTDALSIVESVTLDRMLNSALQPVLQNWHWKQGAAEPKSKSAVQTVSARVAVSDLQRAQATLSKLRS